MQKKNRIANEGKKLGKPFSKFLTLKNFISKWLASLRDRKKTFIFQLLDETISNFMYFQRYILDDRMVYPEGLLTDSNCLTPNYHF